MSSTALKHFKQRQSVTYLTVPGLAVLPVEVGPVAVLVPPGALVGHGTVGNCNVIVSVLGGERAPLVIAEGVPWTKTHVSGCPIC